MLGSHPRSPATPLSGSQALRLLKAHPLHSSQAPTLLKAHNSSFTRQLTTRSHYNHPAVVCSLPYRPLLQATGLDRACVLPLPDILQFIQARRLQPAVHPLSPHNPFRSELLLMLSTLARAVRSHSPACPSPCSHCSSPTCPRSIHLCLLFDSDPLLRCPARCSLLSITWPMLSYLAALLSTALRMLSAQDLRPSCHACPLLASFVSSPFGPPLSLRLTEVR